MFLAVIRGLDCVGFYLIFMVQGRDEGAVFRIAVTTLRV
jgi:hypothetical protein